MHSNADITYQRNVSGQYCSVMLGTISDEGGDEEGNDTEKIVNDMITQMTETLPAPLLRIDASKQVKERGSDGMISI